MKHFLGICLLSLLLVNGNLFAHHHYENVAEINEEPQMTLIEAVKQQRLQMVKDLIDNGADVNQTDDSGATPLHWAANKGYEAIAKVLINNGAEVDAVDNNFYATPLLWASYDGSLAVVKVLVNNGADVNMVNSMGNTALHNCAIQGYPNIAKLLLKNAIDVSIVNYDGKTALEIAEANGNTGVANAIKNRKTPDEEE